MGVRKIENSVLCRVCSPSGLKYIWYVACYFCWAKAIRVVVEEAKTWFSLDVAHGVSGENYTSGIRFCNVRYVLCVMFAVWIEK